MEQCPNLILNGFWFCFLAFFRDSGKKKKFPTFLFYFLPLRWGSMFEKRYPEKYFQPNLSKRRCGSISPWNSETHSCTARRVGTEEQNDFVKKRIPCLEWSISCFDNKEIEKKPCLFSPSFWKAKFGGATFRACCKQNECHRGSKTAREFVTPHLDPDSRIGSNGEVFFSRVSHFRDVNILSFSSQSQAGTGGDVTHDIHWNCHSIFRQNGRNHIPEIRTIEKRICHKGV